MQSVARLGVCLLGLVCSSLTWAMVYTPGEHSVSDRGAAVYSIPLQVPPGAAGVQPKLSLQYNSQSGNGIFGVGTSLDGLTTIARCARTIAQDGVNGAVNYDGNDRLCLDGQRLMVIAGTYGVDGAEYRTEHDSFARIIGKGNMNSGSAWFEVTLRDGTVRQYGNSADSRIEAQGTSTIAIWALYRAINTSQNYLEWRYTKNIANGEWNPASLLYTGKLANAAGPAMPTFAEVRFLTYGGTDTSEQRPDQVPLYKAGSLTLMTKRIRKIQTYVNASLVKEYRLDYDQGPNSKRSRLTQVTECAPSSCLLPTQFQWAASGPAATFGIEQFASGQIGGWNPPTPIAMAGNGRYSIMQYTDGIDRTYIETVLNGGFVTTVGTDLAPFGGFWGESTGLFAAGDFNGDGLSDILLDGPNGSKMVCLSNGSALPCSSQTDSFKNNYLLNGQPAIDPDLDGAQHGPNWDHLVMDVNADGRADIVLFRGGEIRTYLSDGNGNFPLSFTQPDTSLIRVSGEPEDDNDPYVVMNFNGDNYPDIVKFQFGTIYGLMGNGHGFDDAVVIGTYNYVAQDSAPLKIVRGDVNGDGLDDIIYYDSNVYGPKTLLSNGKQFVYAGQTIDMGSAVYAGIKVEMADVNRDGRDDVLITSNEHFSVWLSNGTTFYNGANEYTPGIPVLWNALADLDGDGSADIYMGNNSTMNYGLSGAKRLTNNWPDVVRTVKNGIGELSVFDYDYLSYVGSNIYVKDTTPAYPLISLQMPILVVKTMTETNVAPTACWSIGPLSQCPGGAGSTEPNPMSQQTNYRYGGLRAELGTGRGSQGFRWLEATQVQTGIKTTTEYEQNFPLTGLTKTVVTNVPSGGNAGVIKQVANTNSAVALPGGRYFTFVSQSSENKWDLNGAAYPAKTLTNTYECTTSLCFGNLTQSVMSATDGYGETRKFWYRNDTATNILGLPIRTEVTRTAP